MAMDGFSGFKSAAAEDLPAAVAVMDPFPLHPLGWGSIGFMPAARSAANVRSSRTGRGSVVFGQTDALYPGLRTDLRSMIDFLEFQPFLGGGAAVGVNIFAR